MSSIAFITNYYPSVPFIYKEVMGLINRNIPIKVYSIRKPVKNEISKECHELFDNTVYILPVNILGFLKAHTFFIFMHPLKYVKTLYFLMTRKFENISYINKLTKRRDRHRTFYHFCEGVYLAHCLKSDGEIKHIHAHYANHSTTLAMVASNLTNIPFSFTAHAYDIWLDKLFLEEKINAAKFIITCTKYGKRLLLESYNVKNPDNITVIYHGIDTEKFKPWKKSIRHFRSTLLNVGRLSHEKAQNNLIMACKILKEEGYDFQCQIVGDGPLFDLLEQLIYKNNLQEFVKLIGWTSQEDIIKYYRNADIFVLSSIIDTLPNVLFESLAMNIPVVATNVKAVPELIKHNETGLLVRQNDIQGLADSIKLLMDDKKLARKLADNGRKLVYQTFDAEKSIDQIIDLYSSFHIV